MAPTRSSRRLRFRVGRVAALTAGLALALALPAAPASALVPGPVGADVAKSDNIEMLAHLPKPAPFADTTNSDLAFQGDYVFSGNYGGFAVYDVSEPAEPELITTVVCPGSQNDVSVYGDLLFLSTDSSRSDDSCSSVTLPATQKEAWEGIKIFDISDIRNPKYIKSVETACGSHTHTLAPAEDLESVYVYVSSYSPNAAFPDCQPPHDKISIIDVPLDEPTSASVVTAPVLFADGANPGKPDDEADPTDNSVSATTGCHDLTTFVSRNVMAGACMGDGVLFDITDRTAPVITSIVRDDTNFSFWHSATFNNAGTKVVYTDELGGGGAATCDDDPNHGLTKGADAIYDIVGGALTFKSYFKIPRIQQETENCVAHNGSLIPVKGKDIMVQAWYQGGLSVWDFTDSANPVELAYYDRGPQADGEGAGNWSSYWYNGYIYTNELGRGFDVRELTDPMFDAAKGVELEELNVQAQQLYTEAVSFQPLYDLVDGYVGAGTVSATAAASIKERIEKADRSAGLGRESQSVNGLDQAARRTEKQVADAAASAAITSAIAAMVADLEAAAHYER